MPVRLALDSEAAAFVGKEALSFVTPNQLRQRVDTPLDRLEFVALDNLAEQTRTIAGLLLKAASDPDFFNDTKLTLRDWGHSLEGNIYWFDRDVNFAVPKAPVPNALVTYLQPGPNSVAGVRTLMATHGDESGYFKFDIVRNRFANRIQAFELDEYGRIVSAPDLGEEGDKTYPGTQPYGWWENRMLQVLFRCRALSFLEVVDPRYLSAMDRVNILGTNDAPPRSFSLNYIENQSAVQDRVVQAGVVFAEPGTRVKILAGEGAFGGESALAGVRYMLTNADSALFADLDPAGVDLTTIERAQGDGFPVEQGLIPYPALQAARDIWIIDEARIKQMERHGIVLEQLQAMHDQAREALLEAGDKLAAFDYTGYQRAVRRALGLEARIYPEVKATANDAVRAVIFYFALLLPFAFFCERFFFGFPDVRRQIAGFVGIFVLVFLILRFVHPAFKLSSSPYIIFLAFVILALGVLVIFIVVARFKALLQRRKGAAAGEHETDVGRIAAGFAAVLLGISNLSKRRLRTALTAATLTFLTFTVNSFTSVKSSLDFYRLPRDTTPLYEGGLIRDRAWRGMQDSILDYVQSAFGDRALVVPRAWYLSPVESERAYIDFAVPATGAASFAHGLVGLQPAEAAGNGPRRAHLSRPLLRRGRRQGRHLARQPSCTRRHWPRGHGHSFHRALRRGVPSHRPVRQRGPEGSRRSRWRASNARGYGQRRRSHHPREHRGPARLGRHRSRDLQPPRSNQHPVLALPARPRHGWPPALHRHCRGRGRPRVRPARGVLYVAGGTDPVRRPRRPRRGLQFNRLHRNKRGRPAFGAGNHRRLDRAQYHDGSRVRARARNRHLQRRRLGPQPHWPAVFGRIHGICHLWRSGRLRPRPNRPSVHAAIRAARRSDAQLLVALCGMGDGP